MSNFRSEPAIVSVYFLNSGRRGLGEASSRPGRGSRRSRGGPVEAASPGAFVVISWKKGSDAPRAPGKGLREDVRMIGRTDRRRDRAGARPGRSGPGRAKAPRSLGGSKCTEPHMGTAFTIVLYTGDEPTARRASRAAFDRIKALDQTLTDYDPESELMKLCAQAGGPPVAVSPDLFEVLARSKAALGALRGGLRHLDRAGGPALAAGSSREEASRPESAREGPGAGRLRRDPTRSREAIRPAPPTGDEARRRRDRQGLCLGGGDQGPEARGGYVGAGRRLGRHRRLRPTPRPTRLDHRRRPAQARADRRRAGQSSSRTPPSRPPATPSSSSRSTACVTRTSSTPRPGWA